MFLRNAWYVAALTGELADAPLARWLLGEPVVLYRGASGRIVCLGNRCPHRGAALSSGRIEGDAIACGYHGFTFGPDGRCVHVPGLATVPPQAFVKRYATVERWGWVFVWMGDAERADESLLPDYHWMDDPSWAGRTEWLPVKASYTLVRDNLLDLTHARYVHAKTLATSAVTDHPIRTAVSDGRVVVVREMKGIEPSPFFKRMGGFAGHVDHRQHITFVPPCHVIINTRVSSAGDDDRAAEFYVLNALTPVDERSTRYFWGLARNFALADASVTETQQTLNRDTFFEDVAILEEQQRLYDTRPPDWRPIAVPNDGGCVQAERMMQRLIDAERQAAGAAATTVGAR